LAAEHFANGLFALTTGTGISSEPRELDSQYLIWVLTQLPIEFRVVECIHTALENLSILGSVKKPCGDPQRGYAITASPSFTDFAAF
jgi:hypothetical protein